MKGYEKDAVSDEQCELVNAYFERQADFKVNEPKEYKEKDSAIMKAFSKAADLCMFAKCLVVYHDVMVNFIPLQNEVFELNRQLRIANSNRDKAQSEYDEKKAKLDLLQRDFDAADGKRKELQDKADKTAARLNAASSLIKGLSGEQKRWGLQLKEID